MDKSAIEKELFDAALNLKSWINSHDRGVIIGVLMACIPLLPVTTLGLILCVFNKILLNQGKLNLYEAQLIKNGIIISIGNLMLGSLIAFYLLQSIMTFRWGWAGMEFRDWILSIINFIQNRTHAVGFTDHTGKGFI